MLWRRRAAVGGAALTLGCLALGVGLGLERRTPPPRLERSPFVQPTRIYARPAREPESCEAPPCSRARDPLHPTVRGLVRIGAIYGSPAVDREPVALHHVPRVCVDAVLLVEDRRFFRHRGLDPRRVAGAALANLRAGRVVQGGSTITQQLVKNLYLTRERTFARKLREARLALRLDRAAAKPEILETYLNEIYLGQRGSVAVHGFGAAARHFFGKDVVQLGVAECALLAGLIRGPSHYAPWRQPARALARRGLALAMLLDAELISDDDFVEASRAPLPLGPHGPDQRGWFVDHVRRALREQYSRAHLAEGGLQVVTTQDPALQAAAERAVGEGLKALELEHTRLRRPERPLQGALVALDPARGDLLALVGGRDPARSSFNRALHARRQPGSVFKPVVALAALAVGEDGRRIASLDTRLSDTPLRIVRPDGTWRPSNYDGRFHGRVTLQEALERSLNVPFVRLGQRIGADRVALTAWRLGITSPLETVPALALGASEVTLLEMTRAYAVLAAEGVRSEPRSVQLVIDAAHGRIEPEPVRRWRSFDAHAARRVTRALRGAVERGTARRLRSLGVEAPVAGKTGTTSGFRDAWFVGYTPALVVGVWVGFDDGRSIGLPGSRAALPIFAAFVRDALEVGGERTEAPFHPATDPGAESDPGRARYQ